MRALDVDYRDTDGKPKEACGVFGLYSRELAGELAQRTYFGLYALQHRARSRRASPSPTGSGPRLSGTWVSSPRSSIPRTWPLLKPGISPSVHVRYSTTGSASWENAQPEFGGRGEVNVAVAHNGNLVNATELREDLASDGFEFNSTSDTTYIAASAVRELERGRSVGEAVREAMSGFEGAYSVAMIFRDKLVAFRDPYGFRPLCIGEIDGGYAVSSETCGLDIIGAKFLRDVEPGEVVVIDDDGLTSYRSESPEGQRSALCVFEYVYFARPDSRFDGQEVAGSRHRMGELLAEEAPVEADVVIPVPDSGMMAAVGYSQRSGIPYAEGLIKNRYVGPDVYPADGWYAPARAPAEAEPAALGDLWQARGRSGRLHSSRQYKPQAGGVAQGGRSGGGPLPGLVATDHRPPVITE